MLSTPPLTATATWSSVANTCARARSSGITGSAQPRARRGQRPAARARASGCAAAASGNVVGFGLAGSPPPTIRHLHADGTALVLDETVRRANTARSSRRSRRPRVAVSANRADDRIAVGRISHYPHCLQPTPLFADAGEVSQRRGCPQRAGDDQGPSPILRVTDRRCRTLSQGSYRLPVPPQRNRERAARWEHPGAAGCQRPCRSQSIFRAVRRPQSAD